MVYIHAYKILKAVTCKRHIFPSPSLYINEKIKKKTSNFYFLVKGLIRNKDIENKYKIDVCKIYSKKILLYEAKTWTTIKRGESKIQAMEIMFLRGILEKARRDNIRNTFIIEELKIEEIKRDIEKIRLQWYGHVMRIPEERIPKSMLQTKPKGKRPRGSPRTRWLNKIREKMEMRDLDWMEMQVTEAWKDRACWRFLCNTSTQENGSDLEKKK